MRLRVNGSQTSPFLFYCLNADKTLNIQLVQSDWRPDEHIVLIKLVKKTLMTSFINRRISLSRLV